MQNSPLDEESRWSTDSFGFPIMEPAAICSFLRGIAKNIGFSSSFVIRTEKGEKKKVISTIATGIRKFKETYMISPKKKSVPPSEFIYVFMTDKKRFFIY